MTVTPQGNVYLCTTPLTNDYKNQLTFNNTTEQFNYFNSKINYTLNDFYYIKENNQIKIPLGIDSIKSCNYLFYRNTGISSKVYYCFITNMEYVNDETTLISIQTDVFQTYQFQFTIHPSFIEREHVSNDTIGAHTIPEGLETGEYICNALYIDEYLDDILNDLCYVIGSTTFPNSSPAKDSSTMGNTYNGIFSGVTYFRYNTASAIQTVIELFNTNAKIDGVTSIFMAPKFLAPEGDEVDDQGLHHKVVAPSNSDYNYTLNMAKNYGLNGYNPRNNKLKTYPYTYMMVSNNQGSSAIYHYEDFSDSTANFKIRGAICPGCSVRATPLNYKGIDIADDYSLNLGKFPVCNYPNDAYTNWLTQNGINIGGISLNAKEKGMVGGTVSILGGVAAGVTGNVAGAIGGTLGGVGMILGSMKEDYQHSLIPPQVEGNINCGDVITASGRNNFHFYKMSIKQEYAKIIDKYFDKFGYKVNEIKTPNLKSRRNWNYIKTIDINISGAIPQEDIQTLKNMFDNGITLWHNANTIFDYNQSNNIV